MGDGFRAAAIVLACAVATVGCRDDKSDDVETTYSGGPGPGSGGGGEGGGPAGPTTGGGGSGGNPTGPTTGGMEPTDPCIPSAGGHVLIGEIATQPNEYDFIEIWNPGAATIPLQYYYLSDNAAYHGIAEGAPWMPMGTPETDFLIQFPPSREIKPDEVFVVELGTDFQKAFPGACPDFTVRDGVTCNGNDVPKMVVPKNGGLGANAGALLSGQGEMVMLFCWGGQLPTVSDADYVLWDDDKTDANTHADKTGVAGYVADTPKDQQKPAPKAPQQQSIGRCDASEPGEKTTGGNGIEGHDETSEDLGASFKILAAPSPGAKNTCM
jgi:hypothetical protein